MCLGVMSMRRLEKKESITVEFKSDKRKISDHVLIEAVVAMANTDGGEIYLGVEDDGEVTGLHEDHLDPTILAAFIANKTVPPVSVRAEVLEYDKPVLKLTVARSIATVATSGGKMLRRQIKADGTPAYLYPYEIAATIHLRLLIYRPSGTGSSVS